MQKNESENLTNQQHKTLKRYLAQSTQWRHILCSQKPKIFAEIYISIVNRNRRQMDS